MKKTIFSFCMTLFMAVLMTGCSSDDDEIFGTGLTGKWDLVEVQNGPAGFSIPIIIRPALSLSN